MGSIEGGQQAAITNKKKHGADFYAKIGAEGGRKSRGGGFSGDEGKARAKHYGALGGSRSKIGYTFIEEDPKYRYYRHNTTGTVERFKRKKKARV